MRAAGAVKSVWADRRTPAAADTFFRHKRKFRRAGLRLRIVTPPAVEGAAFEKDRRPDAGAVIDGEFFDIENNSVHFALNLFYIV
jgi:hypothetical protein